MWKYLERNIYDEICKALSSSAWFVQIWKIYHHHIIISFKIFIYLKICSRFFPSQNLYLVILFFNDMFTIEFLVFQLTNPTVVVPQYTFQRFCASTIVTLSYLVVFMYTCLKCFINSFLIKFSLLLYQTSSLILEYINIIIK